MKIFFQDSVFSLVKISFFLFMTSFFFIRCKNPQSLEPVPGYGLPVVRLVIDTIDLSRLESSLQDQIQVRGNIFIDDDMYLADIGFSGKGSLRKRKRSFHAKFLEKKLRGHSEYRLSSQFEDDGYMRSLIGFKVFQSLGLPVPDIEPISLYINERYQGIYFSIEPINEDFFHKRLTKIETLYKARFPAFGNSDLRPDSLSSLAFGFSARTPASNYLDLSHLVTIFSEADSHTDSILNETINIDASFAYHVGALVLGHWDGFSNNFYLGREYRKPFQWVPWDLDKILLGSTYVLPEYLPENAFGDLLSRSPASHERLQFEVCQYLEDNPRDQISQELMDIKYTIADAWKKDPWRRDSDLNKEKKSLEQTIFAQRQNFQDIYNCSTN